MRSTLSPAFTSSKMRNMFVLITECGKHLGDFLEECIKDKNMKVEGCKIERGKYCPTINFFQTPVVIQFDMLTLTCTHKTHTQYYTTFPLHILITHIILMSLKRVILHSAIWTTPPHSSYFSRLGCISFSTVPFTVPQCCKTRCVPCPIPILVNGQIPCNKPCPLILWHKLRSDSFNCENGGCMHVLSDSINL